MSTVSATRSRHSSVRPHSYPGVQRNSLRFARSPLTPTVRPVDLTSRVHLGTVAPPRHGGPQRSALRLRLARSTDTAFPSSHGRPFHQPLAELAPSERPRARGSIDTGFVLRSAVVPCASATGASRPSVLFFRARDAKVFPLLNTRYAHQSTGLPDASFRPSPPSKLRRPAPPSLTPALTPASSGLASLRAARH